MKIFVGSTNPVKINAVINAASETWPEIIVKGVEVVSGIAEQPLSDAETREGAVTRASESLKLGLINLRPSPTLTPAQNTEYLGVGLEGGVFEREGELWSTVWVAVIDSAGSLFTANGARFKVPEPIAKLIRTGEEMGPAVAKLVGEADVRSKQGMIGIITKNFVDRTEEYTGITKMALGLWYGRDWHDTLSS